MMDTPSGVRHTIMCTGATCGESVLSAHCRPRAYSMLNAHASHHIPRYMCGRVGSHVVGHGCCVWRVVWSLLRGRHSARALWQLQQPTTVMLDPISVHMAYQSVHKRYITLRQLPDASSWRGDVCTTHGTAVCAHVPIYLWQHARSYRHQRT